MNTTFDGYIFRNKSLEEVLNIFKTLETIRKEYIKNKLEKLFVSYYITMIDNKVLRTNKVEKYESRNDVLTSCIQLVIKDTDGNERGAFFDLTYNVCLIPANGNVYVL